MSMEIVRKIMKEAATGFLATTDGQKPAVRPNGGWAWVEGELWCATAASSAKVAQIKARPYAEYCFADKEWRHVRISGPTTVSTDNKDKKKLYDLVPELKNHISDPTSPDYVVLRTKPEKIRLMDSKDMKYKDVKPAR